MAWISQGSSKKGNYPFHHITSLLKPVTSEVKFSIYSWIPSPMCDAGSTLSPDLVSCGNGLSTFSLPSRQCLRRYKKESTFVITLVIFGYTSWLSLNKDNCLKFIWHKGGLWPCLSSRIWNENYFQKDKDKLKDRWKYK